MDDQKLLREYIHTGSQSAFRALVDRHIGLVYSAARRMVHDSHRAEGVTQAVFATLAKKADSIESSAVLSRWLHDTTRRLAPHASLTGDQPRGGGQGAPTAATPGPDAAAGRPIDDLEAMMDKLPQADRDVIVLHYLEKHSLHDVAEILHLGEEAAHARVNHAVEQLHTAFNEKGVPIATAVLATVLASESAAHVPIGLSIAVSTEALEAAVTVPGLARPSAETWWHGRTTALVYVAVLVAAIGMGLFQFWRASQLNAENERLLAERKRLKAEFAMGRSSAEREGNIELVRLRRSDDELLRLRREVAQLRKQGEAVTAPETPAPEIKPAVPHEPGAFVSGAELGFMGYTTPEAAMESVVWCTVAGNYDAFLTALRPEDRAEELNRPEGREFFEARQEQLAPQFKGMQVSAIKVLADDEVELKVLLDFGTPFYQIQPLVRINEQWRLSSSTRDFYSEWDRDGEIQRFTPAR